jgi:hypothetical protein
MDHWLTCSRPVSLKEAALDSPTFRATSIHFGDQIDAIERWLDAYIRAASRLANEVTSIESLVNSYLTCASPPQQVSEAGIDHDYTVLALRRYGDGAREFWTATIKWMKKVESTVVDPIRSFVQHDLASLKTMRRTLDQAQRNYDSIIARYAGQSKTKESSSLREDAFQLHEARKSYLKAGMDFCVAAPQVRASLDKLLVKIFSDRWREMKNSRDALSQSFGKWSTDIERVRGWSKEMENNERIFAQELQLARKQIEDAAEQKSRPPRELDAYSTSTVPYLGNTAGPSVGSPKKSHPEVSEKQGWLFQRTVTGKPARTLWVRRWFYVKNGVFGWLAQSSKLSAVEESEKIGVLLCGVRPAFQEERRFCFEVKTKDSTLILQAETQSDLMDWITAFEVVKRRALENPTSVEGISAGMASRGAPFAITPPVAPEFAAKVDVGGEDGVERSGSFGTDSPTISRASTDIRRGGGPGDGNPEQSRDPASRIIQKLDLHRKGTSTSSASASPSSQGLGGIASLIAASHSALPVSPIQPQLSVSTSTDIKKMFGSTFPLSSLAPSTLANPPAPTNLSRAAVIVGAEKGLSLAADGDGGLPGGLMANLWGSTNWGYVNRLERKDRRQLNKPPSQPSSPLKAAEAPAKLEENKEMPELSASKLLGNITLPRRASFSEEGPPPLSKLTGDGYPSYYPASLKAQDCQFRMLFPNVHKDEKLVLVFRATWNPSEQQEFPGRVYVTMRDIYFYSNHLGLVLITGVSLDSVSEITAAPGKDCDFLFIHLKDDARADGATRITVKTFLDPLKPLQRRLNYLVRNRESEHGASLEDIIEILVKMEGSTGEDSPSMESWEEIGMDTPFDGPGRARTGQDLKTSLHIDGSLYPDASRRVNHNATKFRLPAHPVEFIPQGYKIPVVEKEYDITAKSLFHVLAGDKSAVFQILYCQRSATSKFFFFGGDGSKCSVILV